MANEVSIDQLEDALQKGVFLLDVREDWEYEAGHVPSACHIPLGSLSDRIDELPKGEDVWVICQSGGRSMKAANALESMGYAAVSVAGGTGAWIESGRATA
jgi:rhodanese-related sulfurtransferase